MSVSENELESQLKRRQDYMRTDAAQESREDRLQRFIALQNDVMRLLQSSPQGLLNFKRRNYHSRRAKVVDGVWQPVSCDRPVPPA